MTAMTLERPVPMTGELNHSCSSGACGNCGNPSGRLTPQFSPVEMTAGPDEDDRNPIPGTLSAVRA